MLETLQQQDEELEFSGYTKRDILNSITLYDVKDFLESLGVTQIQINEDKQFLICPTICHNPLDEAETMKLYWYQNYKIFHCYTECSETMSIFRLYQKFMEINYHPVSDIEAEDYVKRCLKHIVSISQPVRAKTYDIEKEKYRYTTNIPQLESYPDAALDCFSSYYHPSWLHDGITIEAMKKFNIKFSILQNKIVIPHYDIDGRLIGIRGRALNLQEVENSGKYRPIQIGDTLYSHPLQFNLYGIYEHQDAIRRRKQAVIVEGEKSVLLDDGYYGKWSNAVACCGSSFNKYHISLLTNILGVNEIIVALDKEYNNWTDDRAKKYRARLEQLSRRYANQANFSLIWDYNNLLNEKDSPLDRGKEIYEKLLKERVQIR